MAESAVSSTVNLLGKILLEEGKYLWGAEEKVKELQEELLWMRSFLRKADYVQHKDDIVWMWVCQVQKYVYEAENVIDKFVIKVVSLRSQSGWRNKIKRYSCILREFKDLHQAASSIDSLKVKISTLSPKLEKYGLMRTFDVNTDQVEEVRIEQLQQIQRNVHLENKKITGLEENTLEIIEALTRKTPNERFHAIYGMGGCGKTTLATKVWQHDEVKEHFPGGQAFVYVSKRFKVENVLRDVLSSLRSENHSEEIPRSELNSKLGEVMMKKCLIILDDVWTKQAWDSLKSAFTSCGGVSQSKFLLTTRRKEVATYVDDKALEKPDPLNEIESLQLLQESMGMDLEESVTWEHEQIRTVGNYTVSEKKELAEKMLKVCKGLPLAIVVLGGILRKKQSVVEWKYVLDNISSHLVTGYDHGRSCMDILLKSYDDLPYHLKPCFLHLAIFPEDYKIKTQELYWMWISEGLITMSARGDVGRSKCMEDVANDYLLELAEASLVQVVKTSEGWINIIRLHDLVRDVCVEKASADNIVKAFDFRHDQTQIDATSSFDNYYYNDKMLLRMVVAFSETSEHSIMQDCIISNVKHLKCIRSLVFILDGRVSCDRGGDCKQLMRCICSEYQVLRVLVLKSLFEGLKGRLSSDIGKLVHLRYLSLRDTYVTEVPSSIGKLRFLEILDLQVCGNLIIPNTLWELFRLRHLLLPVFDYEIKRGGKLRVHTLIYLESILNLQLKNLQMEDLSRIKNLRELSIKEKVSKESAKDILSFLKTSNRLRSCTVNEVEGNVISENPELLSFIVCKCKLVINGEIILQENINFSLPPYLRKLSLYECELKDDPMGILGSLSQLQTLYLCKGCYVGKKMSCNSYSFALLIELKIEGLKNLNVWEVENGSMPKLEKLVIKQCEELSMIPDMLPSSLESFWLSDISDGCRPEKRESRAQTVSPYDFGKLLKDVVLFNQRKPVVVILGKAGAGKATYVIKHLLGNKDVNTSFDVVARTWVPRRRRRLSLPSSSSYLLPRRNMEQLLRDLSGSGGKVELNQMSSEELTVEIQQVMRERKCLVIMLNLELEVDINLEADLENTFGHRHPEYAERGSKVVITSPYQPSDDDAAMLTLMPADYHLFELGPPTPLHTWQTIMSNNCTKNSGLKWNWMRRHSSNPLLTAIFVQLLMTKEKITEWEAEHKKLLSDANPMDLWQVFEMCYDDLPLILRRCLVYLASFSQGVDVSTKKLYQMWIASGILEAEQDDEESLQKLASSCLNELVQRKMVAIGKKGPDEREKTFHFDFALRDMCLAKAKEDPTLNTINLAVHLDQITGTPDASLDEQLSSLEGNTCPTSLIIFPDISSHLCSEDNWEWLLYICKHFEMLRVLDVQGMWMTKGRLPVEVGELKHLRYLSLRATWVTQLPSSLESLVYLQTLDLRVVETLVIPDVLWKLEYLVHLYLPQDFAPQQTSKLQLSGLNCLQTLVNLDTDKVILKDLFELKQLQRLLVTRIHERDEDELADILVQLSTSLELCFRSHIINNDQTILTRKFNHLQKLKIKGIISIELKPELFPSQIEELTLKHTRLEEDPLAVLEKLPKLRHLVLDHDSFLGKEMKFSREFVERANLVLCSLCNLETVYTPDILWQTLRKIRIIDCWRLTIEKGFNYNSEQSDAFTQN